jgi:hypothetical protein
MARPHHTPAGASPRRKFDPLEQDWLTLAQALVWLAYPDDPNRVREAAPERAGLQRQAQPWDEWTPELDAALTRLLPPHPEKGPLETLKIHARQAAEQVFWDNPYLILIKLRHGNWFEGWLVPILTADPPILLDVADFVEAFSELERLSDTLPVDPSGPAPTHREEGAEPRETLPEHDPARHATLVRWYQDAYAAEATNREKQHKAVKDRAERAGASVTWQECEDARRAADVGGKPGRRKIKR